MIAKHTRRLLNLPMLIRIIGWLLCIEGVFMLFPMIVGLLYGESDWVPFAVSAAVTELVGLALWRYSQPRQTHLGKRDGFLLTASVWVVFSLFGMLPFIYSSASLSITDAYFEAMSGFTTTGASAMGNVEHLSHSVHLWRAMMQWIGGMGIILFTLAIIPMLNHSGGMQMFNAEVTGITHDKIKPRISQTAKMLWLIYFVLTVVCIGLLWAGPMGLFDSVCHGLGTVSTGGYTTHNGGLNDWDSTVYVRVVVIVFMFISGINFGLLYKVSTGNLRALTHNEVFRTYVGIILAMFVFFAIGIAVRGQANGWEDVTINPLFQIVSLLTSTGYTVAGLSAWGSLIYVLMLAMMLCGACAGSTSGGAKVDRMIYLVKNARNEIKRCVYPNAILPVKANGNVASPEIVTKVIAFLCIYVMLIFVGGILLSACGMPLGESLFSSLSCMGNTGIGRGFTTMPDIAKWILCALMLIGRLEIFTILVLFTTAFWRR